MENLLHIFIVLNESIILFKIWITLTLRDRFLEERQIKCHYFWNFFVWNKVSNYIGCRFKEKKKGLVKVNLFTAPPVYSSHHCHSSFSRTNHPQTVLTVLCYRHSIPGHCHIFPALIFRSLHLMLLISLISHLWTWRFWSLPWVGWLK